MKRVSTSFLRLLRTLVGNKKAFAAFQERMTRGLHGAIESDSSDVCRVYFGHQSLASTAVNSLTQCVIFLPVVERELRVAARKRATFWSRMAAAIVTLLFGVGILTVSEVVGGNMATSAMGKFLFAALTWLSLVAALFAGVFFTSDCLSEEKREGTIGFLFLTDLRGYDVVLGKLLATSLRGFYTFFAVLPVLAITILMGGVTGNEFWRVCVALLSALFTSLAVGMFVSTFSREAQKALGGTLLVLILLCGIGPALDAYIRPLRPLASLSSPIFLFLSAGWTGQTSYGTALLVNLSMAFLLLGISCAVLPRTWQVKSTKTAGTGNDWGQWWRYGSIRQRLRLRARLLDLNPVLWLVSRERWQSMALWIIALLMLGITLLMFKYDEVSFMWGYLSGALNFALYLAVAADAGRFFVAARRTGLVELLLATPLTVSDIIRGHWRGLLRMYLVPLAVCMALQFTGNIVSQQKNFRQMAAITTTTTVASNNQTVIVTNTLAPATKGSANFLEQAWVTRLMPFVSAVLGLLNTVANLLALCWFGMWMGLTTKTSNFATLKTFLFVQVIPWFVISFASTLLVALALVPGLISRNTGSTWFLWYTFVSAGVTTGLCLAKDAVFIVWSRRKLLTMFRTHATQTVLPAFAMGPPVIVAQPPPLKG